MDVWTQLVAALSAQQLRLTAAESFTGGLFAHQLTNVPGASTVFAGSFVAYSTEFKQHQLRIAKRIIKKFGVVSRPCAEAMAAQALKRTGTQVAIAFTGNAGPTAANNAPTGHGFISISYLGRVETWEITVPGLARMAFKQYAVDYAAKELLKLVQNVG